MEFRDKESHLRIVDGDCVGGVVGFASLCQISRPLARDVVRNDKQCSRKVCDSGKEKEIHVDVSVGKGRELQQ